MASNTGSSSSEKKTLTQEEYRKIKMMSYVLEEDEDMIYELLKTYIGQVSELEKKLKEYKENHPAIRNLSTKKEMAQLMVNKLRKEPNPEKK